MQEPYYLLKKKTMFLWEKLGAITQNEHLYLCVMLWEEIVHI